MNFCHIVMIILQPLVVDTLPEPYGDELKGISQASGISLGMKKNVLQIDALTAGV